GGGNMGTLYPANWKLRDRCLALGVPVTILPQSFTSPEPKPYHRVFVREKGSLAFESRGILAPDLALGLAYRPRSSPRHPRGIFLRRDGERIVRRRYLAPDPIKRCKDPRAYVEYAARYAHIVTDRLHFAICGLIAGRRTTLLPNSYHKNASMYETWLRDLGCEFAGEVGQALAVRRAA
ncbi:MAG: polysaccharide pyruvyl transferase family protein, partial [Planctomycetes bacterium]|nr:polysaccharide pyruvyl transferase family protein [Planctomycetota bacterium]